MIILIGGVTVLRCHGSANATDIADVNVWDYETSTLLASVLEPEGRDGSAFAATALAFATPFPILAGALTCLAL